jgi:hypothetical protein
VSRFTNIGFYDLTNVFASYVAKHRRGLVDCTSTPLSGVRVLDLLNDREESPTLAGWNSAKSLLQRVSTQLKALPEPAEILNVYIRAFDPGGFEQWNKSDVIDPESFMQVHVLLAPCPGFMLYSGSEAISPPPWLAFVTDHRAQVSITNFEAPLAAHLLTLELALDVGG